MATSAQLVVADIPGLIEGASDGAGLGHEFLDHVERTRLLVHVLDLAPLDGTDPGDNHATIERELALHDARLARLPRVLALSKADLVPAAEAESAAAAWRERLGDGVPVLVTSAVTGQGVDELGRLLLRRVPPLPAPGGPEPSPAPPGAGGEAIAEHRVYRPAARRGFSVERVADGGFRVRGEGIDRLVARFDLENDEAMGELERRLRAIGVVRALEDRGFRAGDDVEIGGRGVRARPRRDGSEPRAVTARRSTAEAGGRTLEGHVDVRAHPRGVRGQRRRRRGPGGGGRAGAPLRLPPHARGGRRDRSAGHPALLRLRVGRLGAL